MQVTLDADDFNTLRHDAARWRYVRDNCVQAMSPHMDGTSVFRFTTHSLYGSRGRTIDDLIDSLIRRSEK